MISILFSFFSFFAYSTWMNENWSYPFDPLEAATHISGIEPQQLLNLYGWGSHLFGIHRTGSDYDFVAVVESFCGPLSNKEEHLLPEKKHFQNVVQGTFNGFAVDIAFYEVNYWIHLINEHVIWILVFLFSPLYFKKEKNFNFQLILPKLKYAVLCDASKNSKLAKKYWNIEKNERRSKKRIIYVLQHLEFAVQLATNGKINNLQGGNHFHWELFSLEIKSWEELYSWFNEKYQILFEQIQLKCNVYRNFEKQRHFLVEKEDKEKMKNDGKKIERKFEEKKIEKISFDQGKEKQVEEKKLEKIFFDQKIDEKETQENETLSIISYLNEFGKNEITKIFGVYFIEMKSREEAKKSKSSFFQIVTSKDTPFDVQITRECNGIVVLESKVENEDKNEMQEGRKEENEQKNERKGERENRDQSEEEKGKGNYKENEENTKEIQKENKIGKENNKQKNEKKYHYEIASFPYKKFGPVSIASSFSFSDKIEGYGRSLQNPQKINWKNKSVFERHDGILTSLFWNNEEKKWSVSFGTSIEKLNQNSFQFYEEKFWKIWNENLFQLPFEKAQENCFIFEFLIDHKNRIISKKRMEKKKENKRERKVRARKGEEKKGKKEEKKQTNKPASNPQTRE